MFPSGATSINPSLQLTSGMYHIQSISLQGQVRIYTGPIYQHCNFNGTETITNGDSWLNLTGTPFTVSKYYTTFVAFGCNDVVILEDVNEYGDAGGQIITSACMILCSSNGVVNGSCSGVGCCQMPLPGPGGLRRFQITLSRVQKRNTGIQQYSNCSTAFFTVHDDKSVNTTNLYSNNFFRRSASSADHVIVLDWAIGDKPCEEAKKDLISFVCKNNSKCYDSPSGAGYFCNCSQGYEGNPYIQGGCTDIDECKEPNNPCTHPSRCKNSIGSFICTCPFGRSGDGTLQGTGCKVASLEFIILVGIGTGIGLLIIVQSLHIFIGRTKKRRKGFIRDRFFKRNHGLLLQQLISSNRDIGERLKIFTLEELERATNKFDQTRVIGQGGHGIVYKGILSDQRVVAIKRSQIAIQREINEFINEVVILSQIDHRNVVKLYGCCLESEVPLLVYEFISNGTLFDHLHGEGYHILSWEERFWIMLEIARALAHLHSTASISVFHRDIKSSNVLLDDYLTAKVSNFGASRSIQIDKTGITTAVQGTYGYLDPEYYYTGRLTEKSDVYSFGVILAELLTRQKSVSSSKFREGENLAAHFCRAARENNLVDILDTEITSEENLPKIEAVSIIAEICLRLKGEDRPTMKEVETRLEILNGSKKRQVHPHASAKQANIRDNLIKRNRSTGQNETSRMRSLEKEFLLSSDLPR